MVATRTWEMLLAMGGARSLNSSARRLMDEMSDVRGRRDVDSIVYDRPGRREGEFLEVSMCSAAKKFRSSQDAPPEPSLTAPPRPTQALASTSTTPDTSPGSSLRPSPTSPCRSGSGPRCPSPSSQYPLPLQTQPSCSHLLPPKTTTQKREEQGRLRER
jgi:hypothetical protein